MQFEDFRSEIRTRASLVGAARPSPIEGHPAHFDAVTASAAKVFSDHGLDWCLEHKAEAVKEIWNNLSFWWKLGFTIAAFFIPGGALWLTVIEYLVPIIWDYFSEQRAAGLCSAESVSSLGLSVEQFIRGYGDD